MTPHRHQQHHCLHKMLQPFLRRSVAPRVSQHFTEHVTETLSLREEQVRFKEPVETEVLSKS